MPYGDRDLPIPRVPRSGKRLIYNGDMDPDPIVVVPYDPRWPLLFEEERDLIGAAVGARAVKIEHVGSTAVPGLAAKPVIDIMVGSRSIEEDSPTLVGGLTRIGYEYRGEAGVPGRLFSRKFRGGERTHHLHLFELGGEEWDRHLLFRDYLREHPGAAREYARLKRDLAARFRDDREAYTDAKTAFISAVVDKARI
jgi:GrpB-like predicted nucleotidyltransferase (UPF0157 family)